MGTGNSGFILVCSGMVFLMTPALAFFYGGLERRKNILNTMMMVMGGGWVFAFFQWYRCVYRQHR